jgi:hypothetical protein
LIAVTTLGFDVAILVQFSTARAEEAVAPAITGAVRMRPRLSPSSG